MVSSARLVLFVLAAICCVAPPSVLAADRAASDSPGAVRGAAQRKAAEEYLAALASGDARALAGTIQESELEQLRKRLLDEMQLEADRNESLVRARLFGLGMPLTDIERLTPANFFAALAVRLRFGSREFERVDWLDAVGDSGGMVQMVGRLIPRKDQGTVRVPVVVSIVPWGKDWKAALPLELQAQIDDLRTGRVSPPRVVAALPVATAAAGTSAPASPASASGTASIGASPQAILELFDKAEANIKAGHCDDYYDKQMSPNFRQTTGAKALRALIKSCETRDSLREQMITALQLARAGTPRYEYQGTRAIYDLSGQGLPYPALVLEQIDKHWYIAE
ncbi:MAG: hypothetical protein WDO12_08585 [Pseudomonadota bacterium]